MSGNQDRRAACGELSKGEGEALLVLGRDSAERLIGNQAARFADEGERKLHAPVLTARKLVGALIPKPLDRERITLLERTRFRKLCLDRPEVASNPEALRKQAGIGNEEQSVPGELFQFGPKNRPTRPMDNSVIGPNESQGRSE